MTEHKQRTIIVSGGFDDIRARDLRFLQEASKLGELTVLLWPDSVLEKLAGRPPKYSLAERCYFLNAVRYVSKVVEADAAGDFNSLPENFRANIWADYAPTRNPGREQFAARNKIAYRVFSPEELSGFPEPPPMPSAPGRKKVVATGCYDWFHSGHVRFTEEVSALWRFVCHRWPRHKHPFAERRGSSAVAGGRAPLRRWLDQICEAALISSGDGWLDADPEIKRLKPDIYAVNEDGDKGGKREYCQKMGIEYLVLKRTPAPGLPRRSSTDLRGF